MKKLYLIIACLTFITGTVRAQYSLPQPIDLGIQNITQQDQMWCWAAAAQQVILWKNQSAPKQCELVAFAKHVSPQLCCNGQCSTPGTFTDIQNLIYSYVGSYSSLAPPANPNIIYNTLSQGKAIILFLQTTPTIGHFIVLRGMSWTNTPYGVQAIFYVNDPMSIYTQPIPFNNLINLWRAAIVVD